MFNLIVFLRQSSGCWISVIQASVIQSSNPWQSKPFVTEALILWPGSSSVLIELDCFKNGKLTVTCNLPFLCYFSSTRVFDFCIKKKRGRGRCCFLLQYSYSGRRDLFTCRWVSIRHAILSHSWGQEGSLLYPAPGCQPKWLCGHKLTEIGL